MWTVYKFDLIIVRGRLYLFCVRMFTYKCPLLDVGCNFETLLVEIETFAI